MASSDEDRAHGIRRKTKVLILGTSGSGKSTICRHMRQLYGKQFNNEEILDFKKKIQWSSLNHLASIIPSVIKKEDIPQTAKRQCYKFLGEWKQTTSVPLEILHNAVAIWRTISVEKYVHNVISLKPQLIDSENAESYLSDSASLTLSPSRNRLHSDNPAIHFLCCFERIMSEQYRPTLEDILNLRDSTIGSVFL